MMEVEAFGTDDARIAEWRAFAEDLYAGDPHWSQPAAPPSELDPLCFVVRRGGRVIARACATRRPLGAADATTTMACGWYESVDDPHVAAALLDAVRAHARAAGFLRIVGPLNGSTWHRYRFADPSDAPPFFLDVHNKPWYAAQWESAGMTVVARYHSTALDPRAMRDEADAREASHTDRGIGIRSIDLSRIDDELRAIHALSIDGFRDNLFYSPIDVDEFLALYRPIVPLVRPELVLIAEDAGGTPIGFVFAVDDIVERARRSLVMKSAAVLPAYQGIGLGHRLLATVHRTARDAGYERIIHALMFETNRSAAILADHATPHRTYRLFGCDA